MDHEAEEFVADKGYHSRRAVDLLGQAGLRTYIAEPQRGRQRWDGQTREQEAVYANRRRIRGERGKRLQRSRGELLERPFAHCYETGAMRRTHLRSHEKIRKRLLIHVAASNLSLLMRTVCGIGKPKTLQDLPASLWAALAPLWGRIRAALQQYLRANWTDSDQPSRPRAVAA
jgi:transposase